MYIQRLPLVMLLFQVPFQLELTLTKFWLLPNFQDMNWKDANTNTAMMMR